MRPGTVNYILSILGALPFIVRSASIDLFTTCVLHKVTIWKYLKMANFRTIRGKQASVMDGHVRPCVCSLCIKRSVKLDSGRIIVSST